MPGRMEFQFELPRSAPSSHRREADTPLRILVMADFSGRARRESPATSPDLATRPLRVIDVDTLDAVMARIAPRLDLALGDGSNSTTITVDFTQLDDFHPDSLYQRLELFQSLRHSRDHLRDPARFAQTVAELSPTPPQASTPTSQTDNDDSVLLERLLG
ncbi:MAG: type VI secretion system contractile sheath small subunit, partial [Phycisphaerales bacterium]|nr:type VI secretion system contractile sheath small subunit [Phycisphaerales bacterium]